MIGWVNLSVESFICKTFGEDAWNKIVAESGVEVAWVSSCPYPDKITYDLVITGANILGVTVNQALEAYGVYFVNYVTEQGYTKLLKTLGSTIVEFLANLNNLHLHLSNGQPAMDAPAFRVDNVTSTSCHLHYYSRRPALWPIVVGVLKGLSKEYLHFDLTVTLLESRDDGSDHEVFLVEYPEQAKVVASSHDAQASALNGEGAGAQQSAVQQGVGYALSPREFADLHPFHMVLDKDCCVVQYGRALDKLVPGIGLQQNINNLFTLRHPHTGLTWDGIVRETASSYVLQVSKTGLELKGQMIPSTMPVPGCPVPKPVMLFLGSPRCANLDDMLKYGLFLSDIPLHDLSRDFVLLAEQRQAEADLKEKFEKLMLELKAEKERSDALVQRMSGLLACFPFKGQGGDHRGAGAGSSPGAAGSPTKGAQNNNSVLTSAINEADEAFGRMEVIEAVRRTLNHMNLKQSAEDQIEILKAIGEGTYGRVYRGLWHGTEVAIKTIILPAGMSGAQKREKMAVMEAAISSSLSHPNIVQTYTYAITPLRESTAAKEGTAQHLTIGETTASEGNSNGTGASLGATVGDSKKSKGAVHSYEVRLVLELCDKGSLRDALEQKAFHMAGEDGTTTLINYAAILDTAADVAKACIHLHRNGVLHTDLKARNVLLRGDGGRGVGRGVTAKVGDFGLAVRLPDQDSHISGMFQGTLTHMAPETLLDGRVSKASDVYAFGIMLWELYTGEHAFKGVPRTLLGHQVTVEHRRPEFPPGTPPKYKQLACWCWNKDTHVRPTFEEVLSTLLGMRRELGGATPPLGTIRPSFASQDGTGHADTDVYAAGTPLGRSELTQTHTSRLPTLASTAVAAENSMSYEPSDSGSSYQASDDS